MADGRNITFDLIERAKATPDAPALILPDREINYRELNDLAWKCARHLHHKGVRAGDVVATTFSNEPMELVTILAVARLGATVLSVPNSWTDHARAETVSAASASCVVSDFQGVSSCGLPKHVIVFDSIADSDDPVDHGIARIEPDAPFLIVTGSGSTGSPKRFAISHRVFMDRMVRRREAFGITGNDRFARLSPIAYVGSKLRYLTMLTAGAAIVLWDSRREDTLTACQKYGVTFLSAVVVQVGNMLRNLSSDGNQDLRGLRVLELSASTVPQSLRERIVWGLCPNLYVTYSSNEFGASNIARPEEVLAIPGTVGKALPGVECQVTDREGMPVPTGEIGLVRMRTECMIDGYLDDGQATGKAFRNGWFLPGDLARFTENGDLIYCGRADHMMIMNGINIYPAEIEKSVLTHPAVLDAAVIPIKHKIHQDVPVCAVVLAPGAAVSRQALLAFARERLGVRGPWQVLTLDRIPRNEQGKLVRAELAQLLTAKLAEDEAFKRTDRASDLERDRPDQFRQPLRFMEVFLKPPAHVALSRLDQTLETVFHLKNEPCKFPSSLASDEDRVLLAQIAWRGMLLGRELLQAAGIPAFDPGYVAVVERESGNSSPWRVRFGVPLIDHVDSDCYRIAYGQGTKIIDQLLRTAINPRQAENLLDMIDKQIIGVLRHKNIGGKSTVSVLRAAHGMNIPFFNLGGGVYQLGWGSQSRKIDKSTTDADAAIGSRLTQNKVWTARLLRMAGLPAPVHGVVDSAKDGLRLAEKLGWPVVVKPADSDRGEGVSVGICSEQQLTAAFEQAEKASSGKRVIVEREVPGVYHRLFIAEGRLLYAVKRLPKSVIGDGLHSVTELIDIANRVERGTPSWLRTEPFPSDVLAIAAAKAAGFAMDAPPPPGARVPLRIIESTAEGGVDEDVTDCIHPDNLDIALRAAALFNLNVAGIDIITSDITRSWAESGAIINEVNYSPLLGGTAISKKHVPEFLHRVMSGGDGRIPVEVHVGGEEALASARERQREIAAAGSRCYLTSHGLTLNSRGEEMSLPFHGLYPRCRALLLNRQVDQIVLSVQTDELLSLGLPVDRISRLTVGRGELTAANAQGAPLAAERVQRLMAYLKNLEQP